METATDLCLEFCQPNLIAAFRGPSSKHTQAQIAARDLALLHALGNRTGRRARDPGQAGAEQPDDARTSNAHADARLPGPSRPLGGRGSPQSSLRQRPCSAERCYGEACPVFRAGGPETALLAMLWGGYGFVRAWSRAQQLLAPAETPQQAPPYPV